MSTYVNADAFELFVKNLKVLGEKSGYGEVYNKYMPEFGWVLEHGSGLFGPKKIGITILPVRAKWLRWPKRDKATHGGWKEAVRMHYSPGKSGKSFFFAKATYPSGVKPSWFIKRALPDIESRAVSMTIAELNKAAKYTFEMTPWLNALCVMAEKEIKISSGGISNRLYKNWKHRVYYK